MPLNAALARLGIAKQTAKGTPNTTPTYQLGVTDGAVLGADLSQSPVELTQANSLVPPHAFRESVVPGAELSVLLHPKSIGLPLFAALGSQTVAGASPPFTHTFTPSTALPYLTVTGDLAGVVHRMSDCKVDKLTISWDATSSPVAKIGVVGTTLAYGVTFGTPTTDDSRAPFLIAAGGVFQVDTGSTTPANANITAGEITLDNALSTLLVSNSVAPADVVEGTKKYSVKLTIATDDISEWRKILTGSSGGTTTSATPVIGSFSVKFVLDANTDLQVTANRVAFVADFPDVDTGGGFVTIDVEGTILQPTTGDAISVVLRNDVSGTY